MIAVDTNILIRLLTEDESTQAAAARRLFASRSVWIAKTVLLEANWVLQSLYGFEEKTICDAFSKLLGLANVRAEDQPAIAAALALTAHGVEFADAMHLTSRPPGAKFVSFDRSFIRRAKHAGAPEVHLASRAGRS